MDFDRLLQLCQRELTFEFIRAAGPGGQNVNKVATAVQLRFDVRNSLSLGAAVKDRLVHLAGRRMSSDGVLIIEARRHRTQDQNREDALDRFAALLHRSLERPRPRRKTKPSAAARERRLKSKKIRGEIKRTRQSRSYD